MLQIGGIVVSNLPGWIQQKEASQCDRSAPPESLSLAGKHTHTRYSRSLSQTLFASASHSHSFFWAFLVHFSVGWERCFGFLAGWLTVVRLGQLDTELGTRGTLQHIGGGGGSRDSSKKDPTVEIICIRKPVERGHYSGGTTAVCTKGAI